MERRSWQEEVAKDRERSRQLREEKTLWRLQQHQEASTQAWAVFRSYEDSPSLSCISLHSPASALQLDVERLDSDACLASQKRKIRERAASSRARLRKSWLSTYS